VKNKKAAWIDRVSDHVRDLGEIPLFGPVAEFDWETMSKRLETELNIEGIQVRLKAQGWKENPLDAMEEGTLATELFASPIEAPVYWVMSKNDRMKLIGRLLSGNKPSSNLAEGFYRFLLLEAVSCLQDLDPIREMTLQLGETKKIEGGAGIGIDVEIEIDKMRAYGRLILPETFRSRFVQHFAS
jgi:hypothetical protein